MPVEFLTQGQEARYGRFTAEPAPAQLSRYFHFDSNDLAVICQRRGQCNWLGFAIQLSAVRFLGTFVSKMGDIPAGAKDYVASQLGIRDVGCLRNYQEQTRWLHIDEIRQRYGYRDFNSQPEHWRLVRWYREGQEDQLGALGLVVNMIVLWNTRYMARALAHLEVAGVPTPAEDIARLSPLGHGHINFLGRYQFDLAEDVARGEMRPLATPNTTRWSA